MSPMLGCIMCQIDPNSISLAVPAAQATLLAAPWFLRSRVRGAIVALIRRRRAKRSPTLALADVVHRSLPEDRHSR